MTTKFKLNDTQEIEQVSFSYLKRQLDLYSDVIKDVPFIDVNSVDIKRFSTIENIHSTLSNINENCSMYTTLYPVSTPKWDVSYITDPTDLSKTVKVVTNIIHLDVYVNNSNSLFEYVRSHGTPVLEAALNIQHDYVQLNDVMGKLPQNILSFILRGGIVGKTVVDLDSGMVVMCSSKVNDSPIIDDKVTIGTLEYVRFPELLAGRTIENITFVGTGDE